MIGADGGKPSTSAAPEVVRSISTETGLQITCLAREKDLPETVWPAAWLECPKERKGERSKSASETCPRPHSADPESLVNALFFRIHQTLAN